MYGMSSLSELVQILNLSSLLPFNLCYIWYYLVSCMRSLDPYIENRKSETQKIIVAPPCCTIFMDITIYFDIMRMAVAASDSLQG